MLCYFKKSIAMILSCALIITLCSFLGPEAVFAEDSCNHDWSSWDEIYPPTCTDTGLLERYCYICGDIETKDSPALGHNWSSWIVKRKATPYVAGYSTRFCQYCDETQKKTIEKRKITANEKKARAVVNKYLKAAKKYNIKEMNRCFAKKPKKYGYPTKIINMFLKKHNKRIKWKIKNITGSEKAYTIHVSITQPTIYTVTYKTYKSTLWWMANQIVYHNKSKNNALKQAVYRFTRKLKKKLKKLKVKRQTRTFKIPVVKTKKGWKIKKKTRMVVDIATARYQKGMDDASADFTDELNSL